MEQAITNNYSADTAGPQRIRPTDGPRHPVATGGPILDIDLAAMARQLQCEHYGSGNRNAITLIKHRDFRVLLATVRAGARLARHSVRGTVLLQVLRGHIRIRVFEQFLDVTAGHIVSLDANLDHEVTAVDDVLLLITIAWSEATRIGPRPTLAAEMSWEPGVDLVAEAIGPAMPLRCTESDICAVAAAQRST